MSTNIPSVSVPFTDSNGRINRVWYEFLRSFVAATVDGTVSGGNTVNEIIAGNGLVGVTSGSTTALRVGQGQGTAVNADDVSVDINSQAIVGVSLEDEMLVSDVSDNNAIRKTRVRDLIALNSPGGADQQVQYNDNGIFGANSYFTTNGAGSVTMGNVNIDTNTISTTSGELTIDPSGTNGIICDNYIRNGVGSSTTRCLSLAGNNFTLYGVNSASSIQMGAGSGWTIGTASGKSVIFSSSDVTFVDLPLQMNTTSIYRSTTATITASTTQTQGQQALTSDVNEISVCANANDTVTLPAAKAGRSCLVINNGAQTLQVFPSSGCNLGAGLNTSTTIAAGSRKLFVGYDTVNWEPVI